MCGIIGINESNEGLVRKAAQRFCYRGPDASGFFSDERVTLGHHRLAIVDLDARANQPMADDMGTVEVVFNGEIYNFKELRAELEQKYTFRTTSDTEVLLYAYREWGSTMACRLQGMFALGIYDMTQGKIILMRDHAGIKPLYYYAHDGVMVFASELKGVVAALRAKNIHPVLDEKALDLYFVFGYIPSPYSIYIGVRKLERASLLEYDLALKKIIRQETYKSEYARVQSKEEYAALLEKKILAHLAADVPVGVFFSGGTDSSLVVSVLHKYGINLETFSIGIDYKTDDGFYFRKIAEHLGITSHVFDFTIAEFDRVYEPVMSRMDEPTSDNSIFPTYFVSAKAAEHVKVVLSGEGGDEYFYGYPRSLVLHGLNGYGEYFDRRVSVIDLLFFLTPSYTAKNYFFERLFRLCRMPYSYYLLAMSPSRDNMSLRQWRLAKKEIRGRNIRPMALDQELYLENDLLRKTDFATSYASIEGRVPLLDIEIIQNAKKFEVEKLTGGVLKAFLKSILAEYLPAELVYRNKSGFGTNMQRNFEQSQYLKKDLETALIYLAKKNICCFSRHRMDAYMKRYPNYCFALISLYYALHNTEMQ